MAYRTAWLKLLKTHKTDAERQIFAAISMSCRTSPILIPMFEYVLLSPDGVRRASLPGGVIIFPRSDELAICRLQWVNCLENDRADESLRYFLNEQGYWDVLTHGIPEGTFKVWDLELPEEVTDRWKERYVEMYREDACAIAGPRLFAHAHEIAKRADNRMSAR